jgi:ATP-dependent RNA helicase DeaD
MTDEFRSLDLHPRLVQAVAELGYTEPTPIQSAIIPIMLSGRDVIGQSQTGSGKTAAFSLSILQTLDLGEDHVPGKAKSLILAPTRELAMQVARAIYGYGRHHNVRVLAIYGGQPYNRQIRRLKKGVDIVVGTPGRLLDLIRQGELDLSEVRVLVLDEADEMLSMGFIDDIEAILQAIPESRQTALFSATVPSAIRRLADSYMRDPQFCAVGPKQRTVAAIEQRAYLVNETDKLAALTRLFEVEPITSALVFARTRAGTARLAHELTARGFPAEVLNGDLSQEARERVLNRFRRQQITVLVATDVAARGLDIDDISHVVNYDLPHNPESYVHRIGRTGRAGKTGVALTLHTPKERWSLGRIENYTKQKIARSALPTAEEIEVQREAQLVDRMKVWLQRGRCRREQELVSAMVEEGHDLLEIAAAALKLARVEEKQRPIAQLSPVETSPSKVRRRDRRGKRTNGHGRFNLSSEKGMVRVALGTGKANGTQVNHVLGSLAHHADIPGREIGKIRIQHQQTLVDVPERYLGQVLAITGSYRIGSQLVSIERV